MSQSAALKLRDVEKAAKAERKAIWTNYVPQPTNQVGTVTCWAHGRWVACR